MRLWIRRRKTIPDQHERTPIENAIYKFGLALSKVPGIQSDTIFDRKDRYRNLKGIEYMNIPELTIAILFNERFPDFQLPFTQEHFDFMDPLFQLFFRNDFPTGFMDKKPFYLDVYRYLKRVAEYLDTGI